MIPADTHPFYISDSYSLGITCPAGQSQWHTPGVAHQWATFPANSTFYTYLINAAFVGQPLNTSNDSGINIDGHMGLYDVSSGAVFTGVFGLLTTPYVPSPRNAQLLHATARDQSATPGNRRWEIPLRLVFNCPSSGGPFQIGPVYQIHNGIGQITMHYEHWWHGAIGPT